MNKNLQNLLEEEFKIPLPETKVTAGKGRLYLYNLPIHTRKNFNSFSWIQKGSYVSILFSEKEKGVDCAGLYSAFKKNVGDVLFDVILNVKCISDTMKVSEFMFSGKYDRLAVELAVELADTPASE